MPFRRYIALLPLILAALPVAAAKAEVLPGYIDSLTPALSFGTLGIGPELEARAADLPFGLRLGANFLSLSRRLNNNDITYDTKADLANGGILADWYPFATGFRLSGGLKINGNQATVHATPFAGTLVSLNSHVYDLGSGSVDGKIAFRRLAPYAGLGFSGRVWDGLTLGIDLGAMIQGTPKASLSAAGPVTAAPGFAADLAEEQRSLQNKVNGFTVYPVLQLTVGWKF